MTLRSNVTLRSNLLSLGVAAGLAFAVAAPAFAQTPPSAKMQAAREVIEASGASASFQNIVPIFLDEAKRSLSRTQPPEFSKDFDDVIKILQPEFAKRYEQLMDQVATVYAERFSEQELGEIKTFYTSATGKKMVQFMPGVLQASFARAEAWSRQMTVDITSRMREEMKKKGRDI